MIRHFTRLSTWNYAIDLGMYPLGSCTMKYNPRVNEFVARLDGIATEHPYQPQELSQGCLKILTMLQECLLEITGMDTGTLEPAAGAQGELTGLLLIRAYLRNTGQSAQESSDSGLRARNQSRHGRHCRLRSRKRSLGRARPDRHRDQLKEIANDDVAAHDGHESLDARRVRAEHRRGRRNPAFARRVALHGWREHERAGGRRAPGRFRRGRDAPEPAQDIFHAARRRRSRRGSRDGQENPRALPADSGGCRKKRAAGARTIQRPKSIGRVRAFGGNFGVLVRALAYTLAYGPGIRQATEDAVLNANYIRKKLEDVYDLPFNSPSMHEVVFSDARQKKNGVNTMDIAKRLIDYGFHPYTTAFPLIVPGAMMIEPTESESKQECDLFVDAMRSIAAGSGNQSRNW